MTKLVLKEVSMTFHSPSFSLETTRQLYWAEQR
jgi:hypothetical protein